MEKAKFDPSPHQNPLTDHHKNWQAWLLLDGIQHAKFVAISSGVSAPQIRDFAVHLKWLVFCSFFGGFFNKATAYTPGRIFTQNTSNDVVPGKEVPFGGPDDYILYLDP